MIPRPGASTSRLAVVVVLTSLCAVGARAADTPEVVGESKVLPEAQFAPPVPPTVAPAPPDPSPPREAERRGGLHIRGGADDETTGIGKEESASSSHPADVLVPLFFFGTIVVVYDIGQWARLRREQRLHDAVRMALERGIDVDISGVLPPPRNDRRRGLLLLATGVGFFFFFFFLLADGLEGAGIGLVPALLGVGYLVSDRLERGVRL